MAEKQVAATQIVRRGVFDLKAFYLFLHEFMTNILGYGFSEDDYAHWSKGETSDVEFHWTFSRARDSYVHFRIWYEIKVRGLKKVKVKVGDDVVSREEGEIELNVKGILITDPGDKWAKHPILKHFQKTFYENFIFKSQLEDYTTRLWEHVYTVDKEIKAFFELPKFSY